MQGLENEYTTGALLSSNWNRMADLTKQRMIRHPTERAKLELEYRAAVQNEYSRSGIFDRVGFIMPDKFEKYIGDDKMKTICPVCEKHYNTDLESTPQNRSIQEQYPNATAEQREQLMTGVCSDKCWNKMFRR